MKGEISHEKKISRKKRQDKKKIPQRSCRCHRFSLRMRDFRLCVLVSAHEKSAESDFLSACYRSIEIQPGDTLWDIAEETMPSRYDSTAEYVEALKDMNGLTTDLIRAGEHLIIAYEDTEFIP